jgi:hypothetical protein
MSEKQNSPLAGVRHWSRHMREFELARLEEIKQAISTYALAGEPLPKEWINEYHLLLKQVQLPLPQFVPTVTIELEDGTYSLPAIPVTT